MSDTALLEPDLVRRAQLGDKDAFAELYNAYFARIHDFCFQMSRSRDDAADLVSDVFLKAMERLSSLKDPAAFKGWLYTIARNAALNLIDRRGRTSAMPDDFEPVPRAGDPAPPEPSELVATAELRQLVWDAAATLNPRDYSVFDMTVRQGLDSAEVAEALGVKKSHAYVLVSRFKDTVEEALSAVVLARAGRRDCATLDAIVAEFAGEVSPQLRRAVGGHLKKCEDCRASRAKYASAAALLGGVATAAPASGLQEQIAGELDKLWPVRGPGSSDMSTRGRRLVRAGTVPALLVAFTLLAIGQRAAPEALSGRLPWPIRAVDTIATSTPDVAPTPLDVPADGTGPEETDTASTPSPPRPTPRATTAPNAGPAVRSVSIFPGTLADGSCGPRTGTVTASISAPAGAGDVRLHTQLGPSSQTTGMQGGGDAFRSTAGPFAVSGTLRYWVTITDKAGRSAQSAVRTATVQHCQTATPRPTPTSTPKPLPTFPPRQTPEPTQPPPQIG